MAFDTDDGLDPGTTLHLAVSMLYGGSCTIKEYRSTDAGDDSKGSDGEEQEDDDASKDGEGEGAKE